MMTMPNSRGSCRSSSNSFQTSMRRRCMVRPTAARSRSDASASIDGRVDAERGELAASSCVDADPLQHDAAQRDAGSSAPARRA